jgi:hypothetical protein
VLGALRAEVVMGVRLSARHPVPRAAVGWAIGLAALTRVLAGPPLETAGSAFVSLAGLLAAVAGPRPFVRGGPFESLRWVGIPPLAAAAGRLAGTVAFSCLGAAAAAFAVGGGPAVGLATLAGAAVHATVVAALAAAMAPGRCTPATILPLLSPPVRGTVRQPGDRGRSPAVPSRRPGW